MSIDQDSPAIGEFSIPAFIIKLYEILEDHNSEQFASIIHWSTEGDYFIVSQPKLMETRVLLKYFKHNHFSSFLRQLNMYDFVKARDEHHLQTFIHPHFRKGMKNQLFLIKRNPIKNRGGDLPKKEFKKKKFNAKLTSTPFDTPTTGSGNEFEQELKFIKTQQTQFEHQFSHIASQNENIVRQHHTIHSELQTQKKSFDTKIDKISLLLSQVLSQLNCQAELNSLLHQQQQHSAVSQMNELIRTNSQKLIKIGKQEKPSPESMQNTTQECSLENNFVAPQPRYQAFPQFPTFNFISVNPYPYFQEDFLKHNASK